MFIGQYKVVGTVIFLQASVILSTGGCVHGIARGNGGVCVVTWGHANG